MKKNLVENTPRLKINLLTKLYLHGAESIDLENQRIALSTTVCNFGGKRYWFTCPKCKLRVGVLYCPEGHSLFECRNCKNLKYELTQLRRSKNEYWIKTLHEAKRLYGLGF